MVRITNFLGVGIDFKSKIVILSDRDECEMGVEEKYEVDKY